MMTNCPRCKHPIHDGTGCAVGGAHGFSDDACNCHYDSRQAMSTGERQPSMDEAIRERVRELAMAFASSIQAEARQEIDNLKQELDKEKSYTNCDKLRIERQTKRHWQERAESAEKCLLQMQNAAIELSKRAESGEQQLAEATSKYNSAYVRLEKALGISPAAYELAELVTFAETKLAEAHAQGMRGAAEILRQAVGNRSDVTIPKFVLGLAVAIEQAANSQKAGNDGR